MPKNKGWFRFYNRMIDSPQVLELNDSEFRLLVSLWCLASAEGDNTGGIPYINAAIRRRVMPDKTQDELNVMLEHLKQLDLLSGEEGSYIIPRWEIHQYEYPSRIPGNRTDMVKSTEKQRKLNGKSTESERKENGKIDTDTDTEYISTSKEKEIKKDTTLLLSNNETEKAGNIVVSSPSLLSKQEQANVLLQEFGSIKGVTKKDDDVPFFVGLVDECGYDVVKQAVDILKYAIEEKGDKISNPRAYLRGTAVSKKNAARRKPRPTQRLPDYSGRDAPII